jgi:hypothetical protein
MSSPTDLHQYLDELIKCPICSEFFVDPRSLPCLHTYCLKCIQGHCGDKVPNNEAKCPVCRNTFTIPSDGVEQLRSNFFIKGLAGVKIASSKPADKIPCESCFQDERASAMDVSPATMYCTGCGQKLCERCSRPHKRFPDGTHRVVPLGSEVREELMKSQGTFCKQHPSNRLELYCTHSDCHQNICLTCHVTKHRKHDCQDINEIVEEFRRTIEHDVQQVSELETNVLRMASQTDVDYKQFVDEIQDVENSIKENANEIKKRVDEAVIELMQELTDIRTKSSKDIIETKDRLQFELAAVQSFTRYCTELVSSGKPCDVTHSYEDVHKRANELLKQDVRKIGEFQLPAIVVSGSDVYDKVSEFILNQSIG